MRCFCRFSAPWVILILICALASQADAQSPVESLLTAQQTWQIECHPKGCIASVDILRGESRDPPNPQDMTQYISLAIGVDRANQHPMLVMFQVDPNADRQAGVDLHFSQSVAGGNGWKLVDDPDGPIHLLLNHCNANTCDAVIGGGSPDVAALKSCADLVAKMRSNSHLFLSYNRQGHTYSTAVSLTLFRKAYTRLLTQTATPHDDSIKR